MIVDLHCHSYFSDGEHHPADLIAKAKAAGIALLALTDHDTVAGQEIFAKEAKKASLNIVSGIELSVRWRKYDIHVIGLNLNTTSPVLAELITQQNASRCKRAVLIAQRLETCGITDAYQKTRDIAGHDRMGRAHFAQMLLNEGVVADRKTAFRRYLGIGGKAFVPAGWVGIQEGVEVIKQAGGIAVVAHPLKYSLTWSKCGELLQAFKDAGGMGLELVSGDMTLLQINELAKFNERYDLLASTGSDYHSDNASRISLGQQRQLPLNCTPIWKEWTI